MRRLMSVLAFALVGGLMLVAPARAVQPDEVLGDPALESRARVLSSELRCMVCQNQSIDDSDAPLARDLRLIVRERLKAGDSDGEVLDFMVARYGEFVLLRPVFSWRNALLWATPGLVLVLGALASFVALRRRRAAVTTREARLTPEEEARLKTLLAAPPPAPPAS
ncbi:cytochrome c-type biogenesis protein [Xanthobacter sp. V4C-4]|uniref:cytochrome c-type biogenesis protein n=1 Tax=Xanthobacter cornucopiae TaxID=3119924 RepID=UPI003726CEA1